MKAYKIAYRGGRGETIEKKSRFISNIFPVNTQEEAIAILEQMKKQYWDATHHCFAYVIGIENEIVRFSDDKEPSGTAGKPILDILIKEGIHNVLAVVTRYFGGTKLGTGGLVRAYSGAVQEGLKNSLTVLKCPGRIYSIHTNYTDLGKVQYIAGQMDLSVLDIEYTDMVKANILTPLESEDLFLKRMTEATAGKAQIHMKKEIYYGFADEKEPILFE